MSKGLYIAFEGLSGCGKSTQVDLFVQHLKKEFPDREIIVTREPGGSEIANAIRKVVQATKFEEDMEPICEQYLYAASRAQTLRTIVKPALARGAIVVSDRTFFTSIAFQGFGRKLGFDLVMSINNVAVSSIWPQLVFFLDVPPTTIMTRLHDREGDKFEDMGIEFFRRARKGDLHAAGKFSQLVKLVPAKKTITAVHDSIWEVFSNFKG